MFSSGTVYEIDGVGQTALSEPWEGPALHHMTPQNVSMAKFCRENGALFKERTDCDPRPLTRGHRSHSLFIFGMFGRAVALNQATTLIMKHMFPVVNHYSNGATKACLFILLKTQDYMRLVGLVILFCTEQTRVFFQLQIIILIYSLLLGWK